MFYTSVEEWLNFCFPFAMRFMAGVTMAMVS